MQDVPLMRRLPGLGVVPSTNDSGLGTCSGCAFVSLYRSARCQTDRTPKPLTQFSAVGIDDFGAWGGFGSGFTEAEEKWRPNGPNTKTFVERVFPQSACCVQRSRCINGFVETSRCWRVNVGAFISRIRFLGYILL